MSNDGPYGHWTAWKFCPYGEKVARFEVQTENWKSIDNSAANRFGMYCTGGRQRAEPLQQRPFCLLGLGSTPTQTRVRADTPMPWAPSRGLTSRLRGLGGYWRWGLFPAGSWLSRGVTNYGRIAHERLRSWSSISLVPSRHTRRSALPPAENIEDLSFKSAMG
jgi:hypothetical protein